MNMVDVSSKIRINQVGYATGLPQRVILLSEEPLMVRDASGRELRRFEPANLTLDPASGDRVASVDLGITEPGDYTLKCGPETRNITVRKAPWGKVTNALIKGFYYQRCGCELPVKYAGVYTHPACHVQPAVDWQDRHIKRRITGGWHDAGDYGKYVGPGAVAAAHLLYAWKLFPQGCSDALHIPETGNGVPDILNETRFELEWLLKMQRSDGAFHHKLAKACFAPFIMPEDDLETEYLLPVSHCATGAACACLALASRVYRVFDEPFADRMLASALHAWGWLIQHPDFVPYQNPEGVRTGQYGDQSDTDERFWAACELYAATGEPEYLSAAEALFSEDLALTQFGWANVAGMGALCCLTDIKGSVLYDRVKQAFLSQSEQALRLSSRSGYGTALSEDRYIWGSILPIMSNALAMIVSERLTGREEMLEAALNQWDYALGMNALDLCFVTGFGEKTVMHPHHRPSGADGIDAPVPGLISGGPNQRFPYSATREKLGEDTPPAKYFLDETPSADTNEIAIYWNSIAVLTASCYHMRSKE